MWKHDASAAARATLVVAANTLLAIGKHRPRVREPVLIAYRDASELQHINEVCEFVPTYQWQAQWLSDLNQNAASLSSMEMALRSTDDPLADAVHAVAVAVALSVALIATAPLAG